MRYYFNELSLNTLPNNSGALETFIRHFVKQTILLKQIGFKELRSFIYLFDIEFPNGQLLANWVQNRSTGDRELKRRFTSITLKAPLSSESDPYHQEFEWSTFEHNKLKGLGLGAAYLSNSFVISFNDNASFSYSKVFPVQFEKLNPDYTLSQLVIEVKNVSKFTHILEQRNTAYHILVEQVQGDDWNPTDTLLPNKEFVSDFLKIPQFYKRFQKLSRGEKVAKARLIGEKVASLNNYIYSDSLSKLNTSSTKIRDIYVSNNSIGKKVHLSVDVEKAAFEVCDYQGEQQMEILFDGTINSNQKLDHNILLKK